MQPGENLEIKNTDTGKVLAYANDRENIRVEPDQLESNQQVPAITQEDNKRLEMKTQTAPENRVRPPQRDDTDIAGLYDTMTGGFTVPPSQLRATNRAKLYGDESSGLINGHFA